MDGKRIRYGDRVEMIRGQRQSGPRACYRRYAGNGKQAINF